MNNDELPSSSWFIIMHQLKLMNNDEHWQVHDYSSLFMKYKFIIIHYCSWKSFHEQWWTSKFIMARHNAPIKVDEQWWTSAGSWLIISVHENCLMNYHEHILLNDRFMTIPQCSWLLVHEFWWILMNFDDVHDCSQLFTIFMNFNWWIRSWTMFMNCLDEPLMNNHEPFMNRSWTFMKVRDFMNFISPGVLHMINILSF